MTILQTQSNIAYWLQQTLNTFKINIVTKRLLHERDLDIKEF